MGALQLTYEPKFKIVHRTGEPMRSHKAKSVQLLYNVDPLAEKYPNQSPYSFCFNNPMHFVDPDGRAPSDWYQNKKTGNIQWFNGSGARAGYDNIGKSTNVVAGTGQALQLNSNGTATDMNSGKNYGANRTITANSSTGTTVSTVGTLIKGNETLEKAGKVTDGVDAVSKSFNVSLNSNAPASIIGGNVAKVTGPVGYAINAGQVGVGVYNDGGKFGDNAKVATGNAVGSIMGAEAGGVVGAEAVGAIGTLICPGPGTIIGGVIGGIGGAIWGGITGGDVGTGMAKELIK